MESPSRALSCSGCSEKPAGKEALAAAHLRALDEKIRQRYAPIDARLEQKLASVSIIASARWLLVGSAFVGALGVAITAIGWLIV